MSVLVLQIGDIHIASESDAILGRTDRIVAAVSAEADPSVDRCCILLTGDAVNTGATAEFELVAKFVASIRNAIAARLKCQVEIVTIPGNHDQMLAGDQSTRDHLIAGVNASRPSSSILEMILETQGNYFAFTKSVSTTESLKLDDPFFRRVRMETQSGSIDFLLFNSAWMSKRHESPGTLFYPVDEAQSDSDPPAAFSIAVIHHPFNWFHQPSTLRQLRDKIEHSADMIISGHEHGNTAFGKQPLGTLGVLQYLEGGVLQERNDRSVSSFAVLKFDFVKNEQRVVRYRANNAGIYVRELGSNATELRVNLSRKDRRFQISPTFREFLDDPALPLADAKQRSVRLLDFFQYPDLREATGSELDRKWSHIRGSMVLETLTSRNRVLIAGAAKSGKTSLAKMLFADLISNGRLPVFLDGANLPSRITESVVRDQLRKAIKSQYADASVEEYEQAEAGKQTLIIDNLESVNDGPENRDQLLAILDQRFDLIIAFADDEFVLENMQARQGFVRQLADYDHFYLCEFGYITIESLTRRWLTCTQGSYEPVKDDAVQELCKTIGRVLKINAIPHHPWVLLVLIHQASSGEEIAAKNGSYGHLFQAIITSTLHRSHLRNIDVETKMSYLAGLAFKMYELGVAVLDESQAREFHNAHCDYYDLDLRFDAMLPDLIEVDILRSDAGRIAFRTKYSYWFFVAWYMARQIHTQQMKDRLTDLCQQLYHDDTANIFVFLSHLSNDPFVLDSILTTAKSLFADTPMTDLEKDLDCLSVLHPDEIKLRLPAGDPSENRRKKQEQEDAVIVRRERSATDGRTIEAKAPEIRNDDDFKKFIRTLQASMKAIEILGQVLRNGTGSIGSAEKLEIVHEIYRLTRRVNGLVLNDLPNQLNVWCVALWRHYEVKFPKDSEDTRIKRIINNLLSSVWFITLALVLRVSHAVAHDMLRRTFAKVLQADDAIPNRLFDLAIKLDIANGIPRNEAEELYGKVQGNILVRAVIRALIVNYLSLYKVPNDERQSICKRLEIEIDEETALNDLSQKKVRKLIAGPTAKKSGRSGRGDSRGFRRR